MRFLGRSLIGVVLLSLTVGLLVWAGDTLYRSVQARMADEAPSRPARERVFATTVVQYQPQTIAPVLTVFGEVRSRRELELRAPAAGTVEKLAANFEEGGRVKQGDTLFTIDPAQAQAALDRAQIDLAEAEAELRDANRSVSLAQEDLAAAEAQVALRTRALARQRDLQSRGVGTEAAVETAELAEASAIQSVVSRKTALAGAEARLDQAKTRLERQKIAVAEARRDLSDLTVQAGFSGVLQDVHVVEGGLVGSNERLALLVDPGALEVSFRLSAAQYGRLLDETGELIGAPITVTLDAFGVDLVADGQISRDSAAVGEGQSGRVVFARLNAAPGFRPGDFVSVKIVEPPLERVARLPATAVNAAGEVLLVGEDDRLEVATVDVLRRESDDVIVRARLNGRQVVSKRSPLLGAGIKVRVLTPEAAEAPPEAPEMVELSAERRAAMIAFVEGNNRMPAEVKTRILARLSEEKVPAQMVERIESRMGG